MDKMNNKLSLCSAIILSLALFSAFFFNLVRDGFLILVQRQTALESLKVFTVPGSSFLNGINSFFIFKSSLFYVLILATLFIVFQLVSMCIKNLKARALFLALGILAISALVYKDRIAISLLFIIFLSFSLFYLITMKISIQISWIDILTMLMLGFIISFSVFLGAKKDFFIKTRDLLLMDSSFGNKVVSFYYQYSPLAVSVITPARGPNGGLLFDEKFQGPPLHLGNGLILSGNKEVENAADFVARTEQPGMTLVNRFGDSVSLASPNQENIKDGLEQLFSLEGFKRLNKIALYAFPACAFFVFFLVIRVLSQKRIVFVGSALALGSALILLVGVISLTGNKTPSEITSDTLEEKRTALAAAYSLDKKQKLPGDYTQFVQGLASSESAALRYWGAKLLRKSRDNPVHVSILKKLLEDPSPNVRYTAALSLASVIKTRSFEYFIPLLVNDPNWYVRCVVYSVFLKHGKIPRLS